MKGDRGYDDCKDVLGTQGVSIENMKRMNALRAGLSDFGFSHLVELEAERIFFEEICFKRNSDRAGVVRGDLKITC